MFGFLKRSVDPNEALRKSLGGLELPTFPGVVLRTLEAIRQSDASVRSVASVLGADPGMSVRLLTIVNSAARAGSKRVDSVERAIAVLGLGGVETMVLSIGVASSLPKAQVDGFQPGRFWMTSARRASLARALAEEVHPGSAALSFTAGLLQDMAVPLLATAREDYRRVLGAWHGGDGELDDMERSEFGWDHPEVATWLCASWQLPENLAEAIAAHHGEREGCTAPPAVQLVADIRETDGVSEVDALVELAGDRLGLAADRSVELAEQAEVRAGELVKLFV